MKTQNILPPLEQSTLTLVERYTPRYTEICNNTSTWESLDQSELIKDYTKLFGSPILAANYLGVTRVTLKRKRDNIASIKAIEMIAMLDALTTYNPKYTKFRQIVTLSKSLF